MKAEIEIWQEHNTGKGKRKKHDGVTFHIDGESKKEREKRRKTKSEILLLSEREIPFINEKSEIHLLQKSIHQKTQSGSPLETKDCWNAV